MKRELFWCSEGRAAIANVGPVVSALYFLRVLRTANDLGQFPVPEGGFISES